MHPFRVTFSNAINRRGRVDRDYPTLCAALRDARTHHPFNNTNALVLLRLTEGAHQFARVAETP